MIRVREDVECLLTRDVLPEDMECATYDRDLIPGSKAYSKTLWFGSYIKEAFIDMIRVQVVRIVAAAVSQTPPSKPFTLLKAMADIEKQDLILDALLVHPDFVPLLREVLRRPFGHHLKLYVHEDVEPGNIYGFAQPEFVGVLAEGYHFTGIVITNPNGITWGRFPSVYT